MSDAATNWKRLERLFLVARGFFFFGQLVVPNILAQAKLGWRWFGFANTDLAAVVQKFLNKRVICGFFWDMFHVGMLTASMGGLSRPYILLTPYHMNRRARTEGVKTVSETVQWTVSGLNGRSPGGVKRPRHVAGVPMARRGGSGAAQSEIGHLGELSHLDKACFCSVNRCRTLLFHFNLRLSFYDRFS